METSNALALPNKKLGPLATPKRTSSVELALKWKTGSQEDKHYIKMYQSGDFSVCLGKPGKEAHPEYKRLNMNDMTPTIFFQDEVLDFFPTFSEIFEDFQRIGSLSIAHNKKSILVSLACLLYRSSFMLDHELVNEDFFGDSQGDRWHWKIPSIHLETLINGTSEVGPVVVGEKREIRIPIDVYLHLVDAIALNEDVKYQAKNVSESGKVIKPTGRTNTLQTLTAIIAVFLDRYSVVKFASSLIQGRGVASISNTDARLAFPELSL